MAIMQPAPRMSGCERICLWLNQNCGIYFPESKIELISNRLQRVVEEYQLGCLEKLADHVEAGQPQDLLLAVMHAASTNYTYFFREPQVLEFFRTTVMPPLERRPEIRIWSAAASTGDESYTIAIIASELWGAENARRRMAILGTDISEPVVEYAERAVYGNVHLDHTPEVLLQRYLRPAGNQTYEVVEGIRKMCTFRRLNLKAFPYPFKGQFDAVFCRNVLYYFDRDTQREVLEAIYEVTAPGGWLMTSVTENARDLATRWIPVNSGIYRKPV
jgi:chemotaxis protein methyltransferase CheR